MPFFETTVEKNTKENVFHSLKWYDKLAVHFYEDSLTSRVLGIFRLHANFKIQSRVGIEFLSV